MRYRRPVRRLSTCAAENPNRRLRMTALMDRVATPVDRAGFDDLVTLVTQAPPWDKDRAAGVRILLRAIGEGKPVAPDQILARWTWRLARATRKVQDRRASSEYPEAKRLLGALANSRGHRHEENAAKLVRTALEQPIQVGVALLASAEGYTPLSVDALCESARSRAKSLSRREKRTVYLNTHPSWRPDEEPEDLLAACLREVAAAVNRLTGADRVRFLDLLDRAALPDREAETAVRQELYASGEIARTLFKARLHYGRAGSGVVLREGMIFTVEPMINAGKSAVKLKSDGWTAVTKDRSLSAQFEHTVGVTATSFEIFTTSPTGLHKPPYA